MVSRRSAQGLPAEILRQVVAADISKLPAYIGVPVPDQGYAVLRITKVVEGQAPADEKQVEARAAAAQGSADYESYIASLKGRASISVNSGNLEKKQ
jgi:peptidyl-prolyl cis-trans isomerase D